MEDKYTVEEVAGKLKVSKKTILREIQRGKLKTEKVGRRHLISESFLASYLKADVEPAHNHNLQARTSEPDSEKERPSVSLNLPPEHVFQDEDSDNCGPSCLGMVYKSRGIDISLQTILNELNLDIKGEVTFPPQLALNLLSHGLRTNLVVSNSQFISPAWKGLSLKELQENLKKWLVFQPKHEWHIYGLHALYYLQEGGNVILKSFDSEYLKKLLDRGSILILCIDEVWLWGHRLKEHKSEIDNLRSRSWGHFVVVNGYNGDKFNVLDPYPTGLPDREGEYQVEGNDLVAATLTWSGTILEVLE